MYLSDDLFAWAGKHRWVRPIVSTLVIEEGHLLMVRHGTGSDAGCWNLPGGKVDAGETLLHAAAREALEETGYRVRIEALQGIYGYTNRTGKNCMRFVFFGGVMDGEPAVDGTEIIDVRWFELEQLHQMSSQRFCKPAALRRILTRLRHPVRYPLDLLHEFDPAMAVV